MRREMDNTRPALGRRAIGIISGLTLVLGMLAFAGGGARIVQDCLPFVITEGAPARARALNVVGLRRAGMEPAEIRQLNRVFRVLRTAPGLEHALEQLTAIDSPAVAELVRFIRSSPRGFTHP